MIKSTSSIPRFINSSLTSFIVFSLFSVSAYSQKMPKMNSDSIKVKSQNASGKGSQMSDDDIFQPDLEWKR